MAVAATVTFVGPTHSWCFVASAQPHFPNLFALCLARPELQVAEVSDSEES